MLSNFLIVGSSLGGLLFGMFRFLDTYYQTKEDRTESRITYHNIWKMVDNSKLKNMPEKIVRFFFTFINIPYEIFSFIYDSKLVRRLRKASLYWLIPISVFGWIILTFLKDRLNQENIFWGLIYITFTLIFFIVFMLTISKVFDVVFIKDENEKTFSDSKWKEKKGHYWSISVFAISFLITAMAIYFGDENLADEVSEYIGRIYTFNYLFDLLTLFTSFYLLSKILETENIFIQMGLIFLDLLFAAIFAFLTLLLIKLFSSLNITLEEILWTLFGKSADGGNWYIGKWFWLMHTTFIPTLIYLSILFLAIIGKLIIIPLAKITGKASIIDRPHYLTATFFGVFGGVCAFLLVIVKVSQHGVN